MDMRTDSDSKLLDTLYHDARYKFVALAAASCFAHSVHCGDVQHCVDVHVFGKLHAKHAWLAYRQAHTHDSSASAHEEGQIVLIGHQRSQIGSK